MKIAITPQQRFHLYQLIAGSALRVKGQEARRVRRFYQHLGLAPLAEAERRGGQVHVAKAQDTTPALFELDHEDIDRLHKLAEEAERAPAAEYALGPLFDAVYLLAADSHASVSWPEGAADYSPEPLEAWLPPDALKEPEDQEIDMVVSFLKRNGHSDLAEQIDRGEHRPT